MAARIAPSRIDRGLHAPPCRPCICSRDAWRGWLDDRTLAKVHAVRTCSVYGAAYCNVYWPTSRNAHCLCGGQHRSPNKAAGWEPCIAVQAGPRLLEHRPVVSLAPRARLPTTSIINQTLSLIEQQPGLLDPSASFGTYQAKATEQWGGETSLFLRSHLLRAARSTPANLPPCPEPPSTAPAVWSSSCSPGDMARVRWVTYAEVQRVE